MYKVRVCVSRKDYFLLDVRYYELMKNHENLQKNEQRMVEDPEMRNQLECSLKYISKYSKMCIYTTSELHKEKLNCNLDG